ncbi:MAG TPA: tetratricopeptide repeat protein, partial [Methylomirabilota bacterium]|nr:tetratricopeptide repeat protein [Methylomirabilota bacterium]
APPGRRPLLPPPDLAATLRPVAPPLDKPPVPVPALALPPSPVVMPVLPPREVLSDPGLRPAVPMPPARALACNPLGSVFGVASEQLECGRARYQKGELEGALAAFQSVISGGADRAVLREARYWAAETLLSLGRRDSVASHLDVVIKENPRDELGLYATHTQAWVLLERGEAQRAFDLFQGFLRGSVPPDLVPTARHGRALALYALKRYPEARDEWVALLNGSLPRPLAAEASYWLGDTLGRLGDPAGAAQRLQVFTAAGPQLLIESGLMRLGWWRREAGQPLEAVKQYRGLLAAYPRTKEEAWARFGLIRALLDLDDVPAARDEIAKLQAADRGGTLTRPARLLIARHLVEKKLTADADALFTDLLGQNLEPSARAYVLVLSGESLRQAGQTQEARDRFVAASQGQAGSAEVRAFAAARLAQIELDAREMERARTLAERLLVEAPPAYRPIAAVIAGEASYGLRQYDKAADAYRRALAERPDPAVAASAQLALGWAELRRGRPDAARAEWDRFVAATPDDARVPAVLLLSAEQLARAGDPAGARALLDRIVSRHGESEPGRIARLNRAILALRAGDAAGALRDLDDPGVRSGLSSYLGRVRVARGTALLQTGRAAEARTEFRAAVLDGEDVARLGLGVVAFTARQWDEATREFAAARDAGAGSLAAAAEYGLAAVAFNQGKSDEFRRFAAPLLSGPADPATAPGLLTGLAYLAGEERKWPEARELTLRVVKDHGRSPAAPLALGALGAGAAADGQWPIAREAYTTLATRYPDHPALEAGTLDHAEALIRTGAAPEAQPRLRAFVDRRTGDPRLPRALLLLAQAYEAGGQKDKALELYARVRQDYPDAAGTQTAVFGQGRLLQSEGQWDAARPLLQKALDADDTSTAAEAAFRLGEGYRAAGQPAEAVQAYMTAAYMAPDSAWSRRALLGAGQALASLKQNDSAVIVYKKLVAAKGVEPELAEAARKELRTLGVN